MRRLFHFLFVVLAACGVAEQPDWARTVAAYEVALPTPDDKTRFLEVMSAAAEKEGLHVDSATADELKSLSEVSPITFNAAIWRGENDEEALVSAMDFRDNIGRVWVTFSLGQDQALSKRLRDNLVAGMKRQWPATASLPIMPNGSIPLVEDLVRTPDGYRVKTAAAAKYAATPRDKN